MEAGIPASAHNPADTLCSRLSLTVFYNYNAWLDNGYSLGSSVSPGFLPAVLPPVSCHDDFPVQSVWDFICLSLLGLLIFMVMRMGFGDKLVYDEERT